MADPANPLFPMPTARRSFATAQEFATWAVSNLNATVVYDSTGAPVGLYGQYVVGGRPYYQNASGSLVYVNNPILYYIGGTSGTFVIGNLLYDLNANTQSQAVRAVTPPAAENVSFAYPKITNLPKPCAPDCGGPPPPPPQPPTIQMSINPTSASIPIGMPFFSLRALVSGTPNTAVTFTVTGGGFLFQASRNDMAVYRPSPGGPATVRAVANVNPAISVTSSISMPLATNLADTGTYSGDSVNCARGSTGLLGQMSVCAQGHTNYINLILYKSRNSSTETYYYNMPPTAAPYDQTPSTGEVPQGINGFGTSVNMNLYYYSSDYQQVRYADQLTTHFLPGQSSAAAGLWRIFIGYGGTGPTVHGVDDIVGTCSAHSAVSNMNSKTANGSYLVNCATNPY